MSVKPINLSYWHDTTLHIFCHEQTDWSVWMPVRANIGYTVYRMITSTILLFIHTFALTDRKQTTPTTIYSSFSRRHFFTKELSNVLGSSGRLTERYHTGDNTFAALHLFCQKSFGSAVSWGINLAFNSVSCNIQHGKMVVYMYMYIDSS